ncbi:MAG: hypothetical protein A07HB70_02129 [uncultured archaeon A07HB70]|nr:MAG: hypothetical protein A07HB70_02129 [uncultured archaeon A07HB70]
MSAYDFLLAAVPVPATLGLLAGDVVGSYAGALASLALVCYGLFVSPPATGRSG